MDKIKINDIENVEVENKIIEDLESIVKAKYPKVYAVEVELEAVEGEYTFYFVKPTTYSLNRVIKD